MEALFGDNKKDAANGACMRHLFISPMLQIVGIPAKLLHNGCE
jgi:hypothetical protein